MMNKQKPCPQEAYLHYGRGKHAVRFSSCPVHEEEKKAVKEAQRQKQR